MKSWKKEIIECVTIGVFASGVFWWVSQEWKKPPPEKAIEKPVQIYNADPFYPKSTKNKFKRN